MNCGQRRLRPAPAALVLTATALAALVLAGGIGNASAADPAGAEAATAGTTNTPPFPTRPITIIVPFAPGGGVDVTARQLAEKLRADLGQSVIVENKAGSSGMIGALAVVRAPADGHTLLMASAGEVAINPHIYRNRMQYAPSTDLAPVARVARVPNVIVVNPKLPIRSVADLVDYAGKHPGRLTYGTSGIGNPQHLAGEWLGRMSGQPLTHVPYRGAANQLTDTVGGAIDLTIVSLGAARAYLDDGRVRAVAVTSPERTPLAPELAAVAETPGLDGYALENWFGLFAPAKTPPAVVNRISAAVARALADPGVVDRLRQAGSDPAPLDPAAFAAFVAAESARFGAVVAEAGVSADN